MGNEKRQEKEDKLFKDLITLTTAIEILRRRRGQFFNSGKRCQELLDEESKILKEFADLTENNQEEDKK